MLLIAEMNVIIYNKMILYLKRLILFYSFFSTIKLSECWIVILALYVKMNLSDFPFYAFYGLIETSMKMQGVHNYFT